MPFKPLLILFCITFLLYQFKTGRARARQSRQHAIRTYLFLGIVLLGVLALLKMIR